MKMLRQFPLLFKTVSEMGFEESPTIDMLRQMFVLPLGRPSVKPWMGPIFKGKETPGAIFTTLNLSNESRSALVLTFQITFPLTVNKTLNVSERTMVSGPRFVKVRAMGNGSPFAIFMLSTGVIISSLRSACRCAVAERESSPTDKDRN